jgi:hypothetical protein
VLASVGVGALKQVCSGARVALYYIACNAHAPYCLRPKLLS